VKDRIRVKAPSRMLGMGVPDDARPGDLVIGNRGASALVTQPLSQFGGLCSVLTLEYIGNVMDWGSLPNRMCGDPTIRIYDFR
jgi:hypothetical protein